MRRKISRKSQTKRNIDYKSKKLNVKKSTKKCEDGNTEEWNEYVKVEDKKYKKHKKISKIQFKGGKSKKM